MENFHFGENLQALRELYKFTQQQVAFYLQIHQTTYGRLEKRAKIDAEYAHKIAQLFKISVTEFYWPGYFGAQEPEQVPPPKHKKWLKRKFSWLHDDE